MSDVSVRTAYCLVILTVIADQATKIAARLSFGQIGQTHSLGLPGGAIRLFYLENSGGVFGLLSNFKPLLILVTIVILVVLIRIISYARFGPYRSGLALIIGGGLGNFIDRLYDGAVVDFIQLRFIWSPGVVLNIADVALFVGGLIIAGLTIVDYLRN